MDGRTDIPRMRAIARLFVKKREKERKKKGGNIFEPNRFYFVTPVLLPVEKSFVGGSGGGGGRGKVCKRAGEGEGNRITKKKSAFFMRGFYYAVHGALSAPCGVSQIALWFIR